MLGYMGWPRVRWMESLHCIALSCNHASSACMQSCVICLHAIMRHLLACNHASTACHAIMRHLLVMQSCVICLSCNHASSACHAIMRHLLACERSWARGSRVGPLRRLWCGATCTSAHAQKYAQARTHKEVHQHAHTDVYENICTRRSQLQRHPYMYAPTHAQAQASTHQCAFVHTRMQ